MDQNKVSEAIVELQRAIGVTRRQDWTSQALCSGKTHLFFPPPGERRTRRTRREEIARSYCNLCPVAEECRAAARLNRENGIWGGENEEERAVDGFGPRSPTRRAVADASRDARRILAARQS